MRAEVHLFRDEKVQIFYMQSRVWDCLVRPIEIKFSRTRGLAETGSSDEAERSMTPSERQKVSDEHCVVRSITFNIVRKMIEMFECTHILTQVHLHGHSIDRNEIQLILEYMNLGGLDRLVKTGCKVPEKVVAGMMWQVFEALKYMKNVKNMMHRDIKPANILWCTNGRVKVGDLEFRERCLMIIRLTRSWEHICTCHRRDTILRIPILLMCTLVV